LDHLSKLPSFKAIINGKFVNIGGKAFLIRYGQIFCEILAIIEA
jgi:hypothetical protein